MFCSDVDSSWPATERLVWRLLNGLPVPPGDEAAAEVWGQGWSDWAWRVAIVEQVGCLDARSLSKLLSTMGGQALSGPVDWNAERQCSQVAVVFHDRNDETLVRRTQQVGRGLVQAIGAPGLRLVVGVGSVVSGVDAIRRSFCEGRLALAYGWVRGPGFYGYGVANEASGLSCPDLESYPSRFANVLSSGGDWRALVQEYVTLLHTTATAARRLLQEIQNVFTQVADLIPSSAELDWAYHAVDFLQGPEDLVGRLSRLCGDAVLAVLQRGDGLADRKVREFRAFVDSHAVEGSLSLTTVANSLAISASYLAKILKGRLSTTFVDYVTQRRLERAQQLLIGSDLMTAAIAERVGFASTHYFSSCFKKNLGMTPTEYRSCGRSRAALSA